MNSKDFESIKDTIPRRPGIYKFIGENDSVLYVGKAKDILKRVTSYFNKQAAYKTKALLFHARRMEFIVVNSEADALLLENSLIKTLQPKYNVTLKDGKTYTYLCIKKEPFPRIFFTRRLIKDGSVYFGPYTSKYKAKVLLDLIKQLFPLRTCNYNLSPENIARGKMKVCLEYHIKKCHGPCEGLEAPETYQKRISQVQNVLKGKFSEVRHHLMHEIGEKAEEMKFEEAHDLKQKLLTFDDYQSKSTIVNPGMDNVDVFSLQIHQHTAYINYLYATKGAIIYANTFMYQINLETEEKELLELAIVEIREKMHSEANEIIVPFEVSTTDAEIKVTVPVKGDKKKLLELAEQNGENFLQQEKIKSINKTPEERSNRILTKLQVDLNMDVLPKHIECFDNSNILGSNPVSSCVVFKNAKPSKNDYRHYNIKSVTGPDDFASMAEVVRRRYKRLLDEGLPLPQLIVIDGGKGQLNAAVEVLKELEIYGQVTIIGIAKRLEEIYFPDDPIPLYINKKSESLIVIQRIRNEAHRFAITFHRTKRSQNFLTSELTDIPGIGPKTFQKLIAHFKSVFNISKASEEELIPVAGKKVTTILLNHFARKTEL